MTSLVVPVPVLVHCGPVWPSPAVTLVVVACRVVAATVASEHS